MKICYLDRDGIINHNLPYVGTWDRFILHKEIITIMKILKSYHYRFIVITNQSGIARGFYSINSFYDLSMKMLDIFDKEGLSMEVRYCPHHPRSMCRCRKPNTGMLDRDKRSSEDIFIGDKITDMECALSANIHHRWLVNGQESSAISSRECSNHYEFLNSFPKWLLEDLQLGKGF